MEAAGSNSQPPPETAISDAIAGTFPELMMESTDVDELLPDVPIEEEMIEEVMQELYKEITATTTGACGTSKPSSPASNYPTPSFAVGNGGKSESCGASVSDSASSVMAGVRFVGPAGKMGSAENGLVVGKGGTDGCDGGEVVDDDDDEWLARVLSWGPVDLDPWF